MDEWRHRIIGDQGLQLDLLRFNDLLDYFLACKFLNLFKWLQFTGREPVPPMILVVSSGEQRLKHSQLGNLNMIKLYTFQLFKVNVIIADWTSLPVLLLASAPFKLWGGFGGVK